MAIGKYDRYYVMCQTTGETRFFSRLEDAKEYAVKLYLTDGHAVMVGTRIVNRVGGPVMLDRPLAEYGG